MNNNITQEAIENIISKILEYGYSSLEEAEEKRDYLFIGKVLAYHEVLNAIKNELIKNNVNLEHYGLDININKLF